MRTKSDHNTGRRPALRLSRILPLAALLIALLIALFLVGGVQQDTSATSMVGDGYLWVLVVTLRVLLQPR